MSLPTFNEKSTSTAQDGHLAIPNQGHSHRRHDFWSSCECLTRYQREYFCAH
jgi:hypothetical protein